MSRSSAGCTHTRVVLCFRAPVYVTVDLAGGKDASVRKVRVNDEIDPDFETSAVCADCGQEVDGTLVRWAQNVATGAPSWPGWTFG